MGSLQSPKVRAMQDLTFIFVVHPQWDFQWLRAGMTVCLGYCNGFEQLGIRAERVAESDLDARLCELDNPIVFLGYDNYARLSDAALWHLREVPHFVWVNVWFDGMKEFAEKYGHPDPTLHQQTLNKILNSNAAFVFTAAPESYWYFWENWQKAGMRIESLPEACDMTVYNTTPRMQLEYSREPLEAVFVGGYKEYKESVYAEYLWSYEAQLATYGYNEWPRCYQGYLPNELEATIYKNAKVVPAIGEPFASITGTFYERPFKVAGSGGLAITDVAPAYRELFSDDEFLMPRTTDEYHEMMRKALSDDDWNLKWREREYKAVLAKHTYRHRAQKILELLA